MTAFRVRGRACLRPLHWLAAALLLTAAASPLFAAEPIAVTLDQARLIKLPERAATIVIGDPMIADLSIQPGGVGVITGKGYGITNLIVMDHDGAVLMETGVVVKGPIDPIVVVYRGAARETYSCTPECLPRITLGDEQVFFSKTIEQSNTRNNSAVAAGGQADSADKDDDKNSKTNAPASRH